MRKLLIPLAVLALAACGGTTPSAVDGPPLEASAGEGSVRSAAAIPCTMHIEVLSKPGPTADLRAVYDTVTCGPQPPVWWAPTAELSPIGPTFRVRVSGEPGVHEVQAFEFADPGAGYDKIRVTLTAAR